MTQDELLRWISAVVGEMLRNGDLRHPRNQNRLFELCREAESHKTVDDTHIRGRLLEAPETRELFRTRKTDLEVVIAWFRDWTFAIRLLSFGHRGEGCSADELAAELVGAFDRLFPANDSRRLWEDNDLKSELFQLSWAAIGVIDHHELRTILSRNWTPVQKDWYARPGFTAAHSDAVLEMCTSFDAWQFAIRRLYPSPQA